MNVFVTGATGFIGRALVRTLRARGWQVTALVRRPDSAEARAVAALGATLAVGDVTDRESMRVPMTGADAVIHDAGVYEMGVNAAGRARMVAVNVDGTRNTLTLAQELAIPRLVYVSTAFAFGDSAGAVRDETWERQSVPLSPYEESKTIAHGIARELQGKGCPLVIACPVGVVGEGDHASLGHFARLYVRGLMPPIVFGDGRVSFVHVEDVAEALARCVERGRPGETYLLSGGVKPVRELLALWRSTPGGMKHIWWWMPKWLAVAWCALVEPLQRLLGLPVVFSADLARASFMDLQFSGAKAERELGMRFRDPDRAWLDTLAAERARRAGQT
jgi:dihydroflavonol-4-reductase